MTQPLFLTDQAHQDIDSICDWWSKNRSARQADHWYQELVAAVDTLQLQPDRFALAVESVQLPMNLRQVNFGSGKKQTHRIVYTVRPDMILILRVRHLAQDELTADDF